MRSRCSFNKSEWNPALIHGVRMNVVAEHRASERVHTGKPATPRRCAGTGPRRWPAVGWTRTAGPVAIECSPGARRGRLAKCLRSIRLALGGHAPKPPKPLQTVTRP